MDTIQTELPFLDDYYSFQSKNEYGDIIMVPQPIQVESVQVEHDQVFTSGEINELIENIVTDTDEYIQSTSITPPWIEKWIEYKEKGITNCTTIHEIGSIVNNTNQDITTFKSVIASL